MKNTFALFLNSHYDTAFQGPILSHPGVAFSMLLLLWRYEIKKHKEGRPTSSVIMFMLNFNKITWLLLSSTQAHLQ